MIPAHAEAGRNTSSAAAGSKDPQMNYSYI